MKKIILENLNAYSLSTEEKKNVMGGALPPIPGMDCLFCAPGYAKWRGADCPTHPSQITCLRCSDPRVSSFPECRWGF